MIVQYSCNFHYTWSNSNCVHFTPVVMQGHQYETVSGFICEAFGYIPRTGESIKVVLEKANQEENDESKSDNQDQKEKNQIFKLEVNFGFLVVSWEIITLESADV